MEEDANDPTVQYNADTGIAMFNWDLPLDDAGFSEQQIGRRSTQIIPSFLDYDHCHLIYEECYDVNITDTSAVLHVPEFATSDFDHLLLQRDDIVLATPFAIDNEGRLYTDID